MLEETAEFIQHLVGQSKGFADGPQGDQEKDGWKYIKSKLVELNGDMQLFRKYRPHTERKGVVIAYDLVPTNEDWNTVRVTLDDKAIIKGVMSEHIAPRRRG